MLTGGKVAVSLAVVEVYGKDRGPRESERFVQFAYFGPFCAKTG